MKKGKQSKGRNRNWWKYFGFCCLLALLLSTIVLTMNTVQEKEEVSAHPTNTINIGSVTNNTDFIVPIDGQKYLEYTSSYNEYKQTDTNIPSLVKQISETETAKTKLFSSQIYNYIKGSYVTSKGNIISLQSFITYPYTGYNRIYQLKVILQSKTGIILDTKWIRATPNNITQPSGDKGTYGEGFHQKSGTEFLVTYSTETSPINTTTVIDEGSHLSFLPLDNDRKIDLSGVDLKNQSVGRAWATSTGSLMSATGIHQMSTDKNNYRIPEFQNGSVLNAHSFEAMPEGNFLEPNSYISMVPEDMRWINSTTLIGVEYYIKQTMPGRIKVISKWDLDPITKQATRTEIGRFNNCDMIFHHEISDNNTIYIEVYRNSMVGESQVELIKLDVNTLQLETVKTFPKLTRLKFSKYGSGYFYTGQIINLTGEFEGIGQQSGLYSGYMDNNFNWTSSSFIQLEFPESISNIGIASFSGNGNLFILSGVFYTREVNFIDEVIYDNFPGELANGANKEWSPQIYSPLKGNAFVSILRKTDDWSPLIRAPESFTINGDDPDLNNPTVLDRWLLTGSKNGNLTDSKAVKVYDTMDIDKGLFIYGIDWLRERINKNPKSLEYDADDGKTLLSSDPIEWDKLGFDKSKAGAQLVTYFVTDSQNQTSSTSTYVNNLLDSTVTDEDNKYAIDAQNFHVPLTDVGNALSTPEKFKKLAKTLAWSLTDHQSSAGDHGNGLDEDGAAEKFSTGKVEVDATQLAALQSATVAKPYPVDITYKPETGVEITNRVWVFVTTTNTVPNTETGVTPLDTNGVVYYADDYTIPYRLRTDQDLETILSNGKIKAYNYYAKDTTAELAPLPDKTGGVSNWSIVDPTVIQDPFSGGTVNLPTTVQPEIRYKWSGASDNYHTKDELTEGALGITLTGDVLLHVRQVIQGSNTAIKDLVIPTEGYVSVQNTLDNGGSPALDPNYQSQVTVSSGKQADNPGFTDFALNLEHLTAADQVTLSSVIPEFYKFNGYYVSNEKASHEDAGLNAPNNSLLSQAYLYEQGEVWITFYLEPNGTNDGNPQPYSWDYKHNDLGKITE